MQKYIIGNWKCNKSAHEAEEWMQAVAQSGVMTETPNVQVVLCTSFLYLAQLNHKVQGLELGVQTVSAYANGSYTGAISAQQAAQFARFAILGHVERRKYFHETNEDVAQQVRQCIDAGITPIIAVDDQNWVQQLTLLNSDKLQQCIVMYEPPGAISTAQGGGHAIDVEHVIPAIQRIRTELKPLAVLYGGSVSSANVVHYISHPDIDGVVPGAASLDPQEFATLVNNAVKSI